MDFKANVTRFMSKAKLGLKKNAPVILSVVGGVGVVSATVFACVKTIKAKDILDEHARTAEAIKKASELPEEEYSEEDKRKDTVTMYTRTVIALARNYALPFALMSFSLTAIFVSNAMYKQRNAALAASLASVTTAFNEYRARVKEKFGDEMDRKLRFGIKDEIVEDTVVDPETGEVKTESKVVETASVNYSDWARFFCEDNPNWVKDAEANLFFVKSQQNYLNDLLKSRGYVFLNEAYERLGFEPTAAGQVVGWIYDPEDESCDCCVDFGIYNGNDPAKVLFVNGQERSILLDFNVDGSIIDRVFKK